MASNPYIIRGVGERGVRDRCSFGKNLGHIIDSFLGKAFDICDMKSMVELRQFDSKVKKSLFFFY